MKICNGCGAAIPPKGEDLHLEFHEDLRNVFTVLLHHADKFHLLFPQEMEPDEGEKIDDNS